MKTAIDCRRLGSGPPPHRVLAATAERPGAFLLESALRPGRWTRWSYVGTEPFAVLSAKGRQSAESGRGGSVERSGGAFPALRRLLQRHAAVRRTRGTADSLPEFRCGAVGYLGYELGRLVEKLPCRAPDRLGLPDLHLGLYDRVLAYSHDEEMWYGSVAPFGGGSASGAFASLERLLADAAAAGEAGDRPALPDSQGPLELSGEFTASEYEAAVARAIEYIRAGDIFQVNFTQRLAAAWPWGGRELYARLRRVNPAPFAAYYDFGCGEVVGASPELFLRKSEAGVETRPIKGTRRRGDSAAEDVCLGRELLASPKDRAELTMIVDLERNDLGRVCGYGSVRVEGHLELESYPTVHHLVSTVSGRLHRGRDIVDLLKASFPGGSITGAPKVRAMQIIDELERSTRGVYTGAVGCIGFDGFSCLNLAIRTFTVTGGRAHFGVGGGVVADSTPEGEYAESMVKARGLVAALEKSPILEPVT